MRGYPKHINTRADLDVALQIDAARARAEVQRMLTARLAWAVVDKLDLSDQGVTDATHKVVEIADESGDVTEKYQHELREDPYSKLIRIGLTVAEAQDILGGDA